MERYKVIKELGDGTYGSVWKALNQQTHEIVAIKKNEEEILFLGRVYESPGGQVSAEVEPSQHYQAEGGHQGK